jgi:hypothetical protein
VRRDDNAVQDESVNVKDGPLRPMAVRRPSRPFPEPAGKVLVEHAPVLPDAPAGLHELDLGPQRPVLLSYEPRVKRRVAIVAPQDAVRGESGIRRQPCPHHCDLLRSATLAEIIIGDDAELQGRAAVSRALELSQENRMHDMDRRGRKREAKLLRLMHGPGTDRL